MWRLHRGKLQDLEFGGGKLEQIANLVTGLGMLGAAAWIATKAMAIVSGHGEVGTPLGLALAAMVGALNAYINFLAWDRMRSATEGGSSLVMQGQVNARRVKLVCSLVVLLTMTIAALSTDNVVVASADAAGSVFVAAFMVINGSDMLRTGIPDLLDRSAGEVGPRHGRSGACRKRRRFSAARPRQVEAVRPRRLCRDRAELRAGFDHRRGQPPHRRAQAIHGE
jgi:divalent metal cation (Fe/Co/Zn/Cd) transporter